MGSRPPLEEKGDRSENKSPGRVSVDKLSMASSYSGRGRGGGAGTLEGCGRGDSGRACSAVRVGAV